MASAFITVAKPAIAERLTPNSTDPECTFFLKNFRSNSLVLAQNDTGPTTAVAARAGLEVIHFVYRKNSAAGRFTLEGRRHETASTTAPIAADTVPLTQFSVNASAYNVRDTLALKATDVCLNIMPLFFIHGLVDLLAAYTTRKDRVLQ